MSIVETGCKRLGLLIGSIENTRNVGECNITGIAPFLNRKMLSGDMANSRSRALIINHSDGCLIVFV
jgi:hypothetical protein